jgi:Coenzyme PQQ synthesis protein D (PqqD)
MSKQALPRARVNCLSRKLGEELVVYDSENHIGHCLNSTAAAVWKLCDGNNNPSQIAAKLSREASAQVEQRLVQLALQQLDEARLLVQSEVPPKLSSRRIVIRRIGIAAAVALPLVTSIVAPTPASAVTCRHLTQSCSGSMLCCPGSRCVAGICV